MKYIFFDIDGTLLSHTKGISPLTIKALEECKKNGHKIFICTGRSYGEIPKLIYSFNFDGVIASAGGHVIYNGKELYNKLMPQELVDKISDKLNELKVPYVLEGTENAYFHEEAYNLLLEREQNLAQSIIDDGYEHSAFKYNIRHDLFIEDYFNKRTPINKMTLYGNSLEDYVELEKFIEKDFYLIKYEKYAELVANGINKFTGIEMILNHDSVDIKNSVGFGDSNNDLEMISFAGLGIAMGNASDSLKKVADYITDDVNDEGIYNALKHFELI